MIRGEKYLRQEYAGRDEKDYQPDSLDLRVGEVYVPTPEYQDIGIFEGKKFNTKLERLNKITKVKDGIPYENVYALQPNDFYLVEVKDKIKIPSDMAQIYLPRSTLIRNCVDVKTALGDGGYNGSLMFGLYNYGKNVYHLSKGERFATLVMLEVTGAIKEYDGDYQER